jgi:cytochrome c551/c552
MNRGIQAGLVFMSGIALFACGGESSTSSGAPTGGGGAGGVGGGGASSALPCDVEAVLSTSCWQCHSNPPVYGAPIPLRTHADLQAASAVDPSKKVYERVGARIHDAAAPMPQPPNKALSDADLKTLDDWIASGAPASQEQCSGGGGGAGGAGGAGGGSGITCSPDLEIAPAKDWAMPQDTADVYVCYGVDINLASKKHITAVAPRIDNATIVHHMLLYQTDALVSSTPTPCSVGGGQGWRLLSVWAPGGEAIELPPEAGLPIDGATNYVVQVHYSNLNKLSGETDGSGFSLCTTDELRPNDADILAFGTMKFSIPAAGKLDITCDFDIPGIVPPKTIIGGMPHMHLLGKEISTVVRPGGSGAPIDIGTREPWNFDNQYWDKLDVTVKGGDRVTTRCYWENPTSQSVGFGEDTNDEMCYSFAMYYPKIESAQWNWMLPAAGSQCKPTP